MDVNVLDATEHYTLKNGYNGKFYVIYVLPQYKETATLSSKCCSRDDVYQGPWKNGERSAHLCQLLL